MALQDAPPKKKSLIYCNFPYWRDLQCASAQQKFWDLQPRNLSHFIQHSISQIDSLQSPFPALLVMSRGTLVPQNSLCDLISCPCYLLTQYKIKRKQGAWWEDGRDMGSIESRWGSDLDGNACQLDCPCCRLGWFPVLQSTVDVYHVLSGYYWNMPLGMSWYIIVSSKTPSHYTLGYSKEKNR